MIASTGQRYEAVGVVGNFSSLNADYSQNRLLEGVQRSPLNHFSFLGEIKFLASLLVSPATPTSTGSQDDPAGI